MPKESNLLKPYDFQYVGNSTYWFKTKNGIQYIAYFSDSSGYFLDYPEFNHHILGFTFEPFGEYREAIYLGERVSKVLKQKHDGQIIDTISTILIMTLNRFPENAIIFICESQDDLARVRHRLFDRCFRRNVVYNGQQMSKFDLFFEEDGYCSVLLKKDNPFHNKIKDAFYDIPNRDDIQKDPGIA